MYEHFVNFTGTSWMCGIKMFMGQLIIYGFWNKHLHNIQYNLPAFGEEGFTICFWIFFCFFSVKRKKNGNFGKTEISNKKHKKLGQMRFKWISLAYTDSKLIISWYNDPHQLLLNSVWKPGCWSKIANICKMGKELNKNDEK